MSRARAVIEALFVIYNKEGELVPFLFNEIQAQIDTEIIEPIERFRDLGFEVTPEWIQETIRNSILKYRQGGVTTLVMAWFLVECMARYSVCVMLTHDKEHSERLLYRARLMLKNMKGPKPKFNKLNDNEIAFAKTDSVFYIGTAGSKEFGRSATITHLHCSEIAFWKDPASLMKSLFQAVPKRSGIIIQETTANGWGNWFQKSFYNYLQGKGGFQGRFYPWFIHEEYTSQTPWNTIKWETEDYTEFKTNGKTTQVANEKILYKLIRRRCPSFTREQILQKLQWRREKILENVGDKSFRNALKDFQQEYPASYQEAFTVTGGSLFGNVRALESNDWVYLGRNSYGHRKHPVANFTYTLGADFAGGTGNDYSTINVLCLETQEQVFEFRDNYIDPLEFSELICVVGNKYNEAYLVPENNAHGLAGTAIIKRHYNLLRIYKYLLNKGGAGIHLNIPTYGYGWKTTHTNKPYMIGIAQQLLGAGWKIYSLTLEDELRSFTEDPETGKIEGVGSHDDTGISFMLACLGILKLLRLQGLQFLEDEVREIPDVSQAVLEHKTPANDSLQVVKQKEIKVTWRDEEGHYLLPFKDMFTKARRKSVHA